MQQVIQPHFTDPFLSSSPAAATPSATSTMLMKRLLTTSGVLLPAIAATTTHAEPAAAKEVMAMMHQLPLKKRKLEVLLRMQKQHQGAWCTEQEEVAPSSSKLPLPKALLSTRHYCGATQEEARREAGAVSTMPDVVAEEEDSTYDTEEEEEEEEEQEEEESEEEEEEEESDDENEEEEEEDSETTDIEEGSEQERELTRVRRRRVTVQEEEEEEESEEEFVVVEQKWVQVAKEDDLQEDKGFLVEDVEGVEHGIALFLHRQRIYAIENRCPHAGGPLVDGEIEDIEDCATAVFPRLPRRPSSMMMMRCNGSSGNNPAKSPEEEVKVICPWHSLRFGLESGRCTTVLLGNPKARVFPVRVDPSSRQVFVQLSLPRSTRF